MAESQVNYAKAVSSGDRTVTEKQIIVWCRTEDLDSVLSALEGYGFTREDEPIKNPQEDIAIGSYVGIAGKMSDALLIKLQQNEEVAAVEILK